MATSYVFPPELANYDFWMTLSFYEYRVPNRGGEPTALLNPLGTVRLPLPNQLVDHQDVLYAAEEMGLVAGATLSKFQSSRAGGSTVAGAAGDAAIAATGAAAQRGALNLTGAFGTAILQTQGLAVNPFLSVLFKSPAFRKHVMKWVLTPTNEQESRIMDGITKYMRWNQLPGRSPALGGTMLQYPNIVQVAVSHANEPNINNNNTYWTFKFRPAVIETLAINWAPFGQPSMFASTAAPTAAEITMSLLEIEYFLKEDYGPTGSAGGGLPATISDLLPSGLTGNPTTPAGNDIPPLGNPL